MPSVELFYSKRSQTIEDWVPIYKELQESGHTLHTEPVECDVSVVLNGKMVNPVPLYGKKILLYRMKDWQPMKWDALFSLILEEYYDEMIDITDKDIGTVIEKIH